MKRMKLAIVLATGLMASGIAAGPKIERAKGFAKVGFHLTEVALGALFIRNGIHLGGNPVRRYVPLGIGTLCIAKGLYDLKVDLHRHMFAHLNAWWNYKTQQKSTDVEAAEA